MAASNGRGAIAPVSFPPPVDSRREFIKRTLDPEEDRIEVGVAIVGGGTAGLACATRLLQLLEDDPETVERPGIPLRRPGHAREMAAVISFLAGPESTYVTGSSFVADGGLTLMAAVQGGEAP